MNEIGYCFKLHLAGEGKIENQLIMLYFLQFKCNLVAPTSVGRAHIDQVDNLCQLE